MLDDGKHPYRQFLVSTQCKSCGIHDAQIFDHRFIKAQGGVPGGRWVFVGVGTVDAIYFGSLKNQFGPNFSAAQGRCRVGGKERVASTRSKNHHLTFF